ncbi:glycosyltransferase [Deinococcus sp. RIT780]|uniref:glycosyltransferase n=1 Tax=Deinococcus sp. RIT780 TaxID=2870472 RepID=UPI001C8A5385|nr:glycosyltransferase [Deinococcus sp. RIT780]MBX8465029.1 glycosyltransferase [Deinococcus sp. RIT780]
MKKGNILTVTTISRTNEAFLVDVNHSLKDFNHFAAASDIVNSKVSTKYKKVFDLPIQRGFKSLLYYRKFQNILLSKIVDYDIDIVHVHTPVAAFMVRFALRKKRIRQRLKIKLVYTAHGLHFFPGNSLVKNLIYGIAEYIAGRWTDKLIVINRTDEESARKYKIVEPNKIIFMPGIGVDLKKYSDVENKVAITYTPYFLMVAEFIPRKRHRDVLNALAKCQTGFNLYLAGDGILENEIKQLSIDLNIQGRVIFLGHRSDIPDLMKNSLAVILASSQEGLPRSILEAMALGTLSIASRIRGNVDLLKDQNGILFDVGNIEQLTEIMNHVFSQPDSYTMIKENAKSKIKEYSLERISELHNDLYTSLINK